LEEDLEQAIMDNLQNFLLELGRGFAFVARQQRINFSDEDFYVDLKLGKLTHQDMGQMVFDFHSI
jgi:predicted nuclease of restriction endonuclease-like (RecB) superfamily